MKDRFNDFKGRVNYAAQCLVNGTRSRAFDSCFEMFDGALVVTALVRRAERNARLAAHILPQWKETAAKYSAIETQSLDGAAALIRIAKSTQ